MVQLSNRANITPIASQVVFVDGLSGSGKTALSPILQGFERVENVQVKPVLDILCCYHYLKEMSPAATESALRLLLDQFVYDNSISREVNLRPSDLTSVLKSNLRSKYLDRLFMADGASAIERIEKEKPILHLMGHQLFAVSKPLFSILKVKLTFLEILRHPLTTLTHWLSYIERIGNDASEFSVWLHHEGQIVPWFVRGHEARYLSLNRMDKVILSLRCLEALRKSTVLSLEEDERRRLLVIPFERFVKDPQPYLDRISKLLGAAPTESMDRILKEQKIPRTLSSDSPGGVWEQKYNQARPEVGATEEGEHARIWKLAELEASPEALVHLRELCSNHEALLKVDTT